MDPRRLLIFRDVARAGSISAAARALGWTQPAVSQHLRALEAEARSPLLLRGARGVSLTEAGSRLLARADAVAGQLRLAERELEALADRTGGRVRVAGYAGVAGALLPAVLARLAAAHPGVEAGLVEAEPPDAVALVEAGEVDLAVVHGYGREDVTGRGLRWRRLGEEAYDLLLPPGHGLATEAAVATPLLAWEPWIVGCERCRAHLVGLCANAGFEPDVRHVSDDPVVVQALVAAGLGVALVGRTTLAAYRRPDVVVRASTGWGRRTYGVVHRDGADTVPAVAALLELLDQPVAQP